MALLGGSVARAAWRAPSRSSFLYQGATQHRNAPLCRSCSWGLINSTLSGCLAPALHQDSALRHCRRTGRWGSRRLAALPPRAIVLGAMGLVVPAECPASTPLEPGLVRLAPLPPIQEAKRVILVRHGESTWNASGRIQGSSDFSVLTPKGESQAETNRQMLRESSFDVMFHSPLKRAARTAQIIWDDRDGPIHVLDDLREIDLYAFQGLFKNEGKAQYGDAFHQWLKDAPNFLIDGHYPVRELWERGARCWDVILRTPGRSVLVVAHNAVNQALVATAAGLGPEYFRQLLQSNCGVSVLDFSPSVDPQGPPHICLDRLNQTPSPPVGGAGGAGRSSKHRLILIRHGDTDSTAQDRFPATDDEPLNMLGRVQIRKTAELLLDVVVDTIITSPLPRAVATAKEIMEIQEFADCLGSRECRPRFVELLELPELREMELGEWKGMPEVEVTGQSATWPSRISQLPGGESVHAIWNRAGTAWQRVLQQLAKPLPPASDDDDDEGEDGSAEAKKAKVVVVVGHELLHVAMLGHGLGLQADVLGKFRFDTGGVSVVDFPDGPEAPAVVRCLNYTAHLGRWAVPVTRPSIAEDDF